MKAIQTRFLGPTNYRGARITAWAEGGSDDNGRPTPHRVTLSYDYELRTGQDCHRPAAYALRDKLGWTGELIGGALPNGDYAWVFGVLFQDVRADH